MLRISAVALALLLAACDGPPPPKYPVPKFHVGAFVVSKLSGQRGQVIRTRCWTNEERCLYDVRFVANQSTTRTHTFGADDPITTSPLAEITNMREYELEEAH